MRNAMIEKRDAKYCTKYDTTRYSAGNSYHMQKAGKDEMKKIIFIIDILLILITMALFVYYDNSKSYGLAALEDVGKVVICLISLGVEAVILIILFITWLYKKLKNKQI